MATSTQAIVFGIAFLLVAIQSVHADYYRPRPTTTPQSSPPYVAEPEETHPHPTPKPILYIPPPNYKPPTGSYEQQFLDPQNAVRLNLGLSPLVWDSKIAGYATWWANQRRYDCSLTHSTGPYGENIFWGSGSDFTPTFAVESWIVEAKYYNHMTNQCDNGMCGHYTQIVWRDSKRMGCARVVCENGAGTFMTCNYDPPGNYVGENPY